MPVLITLLSLVFAAFSLGNAAYAKTALWEQTSKDWFVYGNPDTRSCVAITAYQSGKKMGIVFAPDDISITITNVESVFGADYELPVFASTGAKGKLYGTAEKPGEITFRNLNSDVLVAFGDSHSIAIRGIGTFDLSGSKKAMLSAMDCWKMMNSF